MTDLRIILASGSPRRAEILRNIGVNFEICPTDTDETVEPGIPPSQLVCELAFRKANAAAAQLPENGPDTFIIAADTIVVRNGKVLGKPKDEDDAYRMLKTLSGSVHSVYTGFSLSQKDFYFTDHAVTDVEFMQLSDDLIYRYKKPVNRWTKPALTASKAKAPLLSAAFAAIILTSWVFPYRLLS